MKGAIFDMDGLLLDTERIYAQYWIDTAKQFGVDLGKNFRSEISGTNKIRARKIIQRIFPDQDPTVLSKRRMEEAYKVFQKAVPVKKGAFQILDYFKKEGYRIALASGSEPELIEDLTKRAELRSYFDVVVSGCDLENGKPAPDIFLLAAEKIGCDPKECYVFEDSPNGIVAGKRAGCRVIMIPDLIDPNDEIRDLTWGIFSDLGEACRMIEEEDSMIHYKNLEIIA